MFLCQTCAHPDIRNQFAFSYSLSKGPCENCGYADLTLDIFHEHVKINPNWQAEVQAELDAAGITASSRRYHNKNDKGNQ